MKRRSDPQKKKKTLPSGKKPSAGTNGASVRGRSNGAAPRPRVNGSGLRQPLEQPMEMPKSKLPPTDLAVFRHLLLQIRRQLLGDVDHMESEALNTSRSDASGDLSLMPIHMADIGTDNYEREFTIGLIENETETLREIDAALERIEAGTYGVCEATRKPIGKARLKVMPWARYCVAHERNKESDRNHRR
jgi:DnaK suppressor protein